MQSSQSSKQLKATTSHLAALAPKHQARIENSFRGPRLPSIRTINVPRTRLPPRSRLGCWTCRTRKVKCDEVRPKCTPCARLSQNCDYSPRLSFKDDTLRIIERMSGKRGASGPAWDPLSENRHPQRRPEEDILPSFATLRTDEEREIKAEFRKPGSYHVIVNPSSFDDCKDYGDKASSNCCTPWMPKHSNGARITNDGTSYTPLQPTDHYINHTQKFGDPDVVVLKVFEDESLRTIQSPSELFLAKESKSADSTSVDSSSISILPRPVDCHNEEPVRHRPENKSSMHFSRAHRRDKELIHHFRTVINCNLIQVHRDSLDTPVEKSSVSSADAFESQAASFPPLHHALMALSALSMSRQSGSNSGLTAIALEHYQQSLPSLQASLCTERDLASDGIFLTHFVLLLYELAAGEPYGMSLWQQHIYQLLRIVLLRRKLCRAEPYSFLIWWVANIDTHIVLNGLGNGTFVETMLQHDLLPSNQDARPKSSLAAPLTSPCTSNVPHPVLPSILAFHRRICNLAARLGLLSRDLREEESREPAASCDRATIAKRQKRVDDLQNLLWCNWKAPMTCSPPGNYALHIGARGSFEHSYALHRALVIYLHTSLPVSPTSPDSASLETGIYSAAQDILKCTREIVAHSHHEHEFIVFPLFMAGYVSQELDEKIEILGLMRNLEANSIGKNVTATRKLLEAIYYRRDQKLISHVNEKIPSLSGGDVDWVALIKELGWQTVSSC